MPFTALRESFPDRRFLAAALALNFVILPSVAFGLSQLARRHGPSISAVLTVLLTPCTDYVIVFTRLAAEATEAVRGRALAAARSPQASAIAIASGGGAPIRADCRHFVEYRHSALPASRSTRRGGQRTGAAPAAVRA